MNGERIKLTRRSVESQAPAEHGDLFLWDNEVLGFGVKVSAAGRRSYILQYRFGGRARRSTIGAHGSPWTPDTAIHHRCLRLPDSKTGAKVVHVGAAAIKVIEAIPEAPGNPFLLLGWNGQGALVNLQSVWKRIRKAAGLEDVRLHDLRHAFASLGVAGGDSLVIVGALLGHRSAKTTERYGHLAEHPVKDAANRISREVARLMGDDGAVAEPGEASVSAIDEASLAPFASILGQARQTRWLDVTTTAARLGVKVSTLHTYRWLGNGPACRKIGRRVV